jgi:Arc/MetJ family transcription regulator
MPRMVKKTIELNQDHIDRARTIFRAKTDKQAVNRALEMVVIDDEIVKAHEAVGGKGRLIEEVFE